MLENSLHPLDKWSRCEELTRRIGVVNVGERVRTERRLGTQIYFMFWVLSVGRSLLENLSVVFDLALATWLDYKRERIVSAST